MNFVRHFNLECENYETALAATYSCNVVAIFNLLKRNGLSDGNARKFCEFASLASCESRNQQSLFSGVVAARRLTFSRELTLTAPSSHPRLPPERWDALLLPPAAVFQLAVHGVY
jgi:hypothetical protein